MIVQYSELTDHPQLMGTRTLTNAVERDQYGRCILVR